MATSRQLCCMMLLAAFSNLFVSLDGASDGDCSMTFTVPASAIQSQCTASQSSTAVEEIRREFQSVLSDSAQLRAELEALRNDYQGMVEAVKKLETETSSWRTIVEWPQFDQSFTPQNVSEIISSMENYQDCYDANRQRKKQGIYTLKPEGAYQPFFAYCDGEGYTLIERRMDGKVDFYRPWSEYSSGFGEMSGEFWLGLENIHLITKDKPHELKVEVLGWNNKLSTEIYPGFQVDSENDDYRLHIGNMTDGNGHNVMAPLDSLAFTTKDRDNDLWERDNCADYYRGAWWLRDCGTVDPNREWCDGRGCAIWGDQIIEKIVIKMRPSGSRPITREGVPRPRTPPPRVHPPEPRTLPPIIIAPPEPTTRPPPIYNPGRLATTKKPKKKPKKPKKPKKKKPKKP